MPIGDEKGRWERPYEYERLGDGYRVRSYRADGRPGGDDLDADIELLDGEIVP